MHPHEPIYESTNCFESFIADYTFFIVSNPWPSGGNVTKARVNEARCFGVS